MSRKRALKSRTNDQIILEKIVQDKWSESDDALSISEFFEIFTASEILKDHDLSYDDISYGLVGDGGDGGIDSIFTFVNGEMVKEDTSLSSTQKKNTIELFIIQSKTSPSFSERAVLKLRETSEDLLNLANTPDDYLDRYNSQLIERVKLFRDSYSQLASSFPQLQINYFYATQGESADPKVQNKVDKLQAALKSMFSGAEFSFEFLGASELLALTRNVPSTSRSLEVSESPISTATGSYLCLVSLSNYYEFISDNNTLARSIFESNVRDYQGSVTVNTGIRQTLQNDASDNFWYLNNGVTVITPKAVLSGKTLTIEDPQIVNGLQTSFEVHQHFSKKQDYTGDDRAILVRIICEEDEDARDRIIKATNSQTNIPPASLRSSDEIHRNIEDFLKANGYFYDRKKNHYKNQGKPVSKIISIPYLAQAAMATILLKPDSARARPSTLINSEIEYRKIFSLDYPIDIYLKVILIIKSVETFFKPENCGRQLERKTVTNLKYYVAMLVAVGLVNDRSKLLEELAAMPSIDVPQDLLRDALEKATTEFEKLGATDQVAKGSQLVSALLN